MSGEKHELAQILSEETGRPVEDFIPDYDEHPLPDHSDKIARYWGEEDG